MNGIIILPLVPLRANDSERSEMISQLLFGERVEIIEERERWLFVRNYSDNYSGWLDRKMVVMLTNEESIRLENVLSYCVPITLLQCLKVTSGEKMFIPGGSLLPDIKNNRFNIENEAFDTIIPPLSKNSNKIGNQLVEVASQYLNAPYLWGGKSIMGIDCSGLVQVVFAICGIQIPRDASQQVENGKVIDFLSEAKTGDLAFFENKDGQIIHVGLLLNSQKIIHASGWVKIESIDSQGIISAQTGKYTHKLRIIKRLI